MKSTDPRFCAICGSPTAGEYFDDPHTHFCNRCGQYMELARIYPWKGIEWRLLQPFLHVERFLKDIKARFVAK